MVLIAACILSKTGKLLVARQFVNDMMRSRLEGLVDAFPKLIGNEKEAGQLKKVLCILETLRH